METPTLPKGMCVSVSPYSFNSPGGVDRTDLEGGVARYAMAWDRSTQVFNCTLMLSKELFSVWNVFYLRKIKKGAISFLMDIDSGFGVEPHVCNIMADTYSATLTSGTMYAVAFQIEAEASTTYDLTDEEVDGILDLNDSTGGHPKRLLDRLAIFANFDTNVLNF